MAQLSLSALKWASRCLPPQERRAILGLIPKDQRVRDATLRREWAERIVAFGSASVKNEEWAIALGICPLSIESFHDDWRNLIDAPWGPIGAAKIERVMRFMRKLLLSAILRKEDLSTLLAAETRDERDAWVTNIRKRLGWRTLFKILGTRMVALGGLKRAKAAQIRGLGDVEAEYIRVLTEVPVRENRCVSWALRGQLDEIAYPAWATENTSTTGSIAWVHGDIEEIVTTSTNSNRFDGIYLSNVPDYLPDATRLFQESVRLCKPGAPVVALRQHGAKDWTLSLPDVPGTSVEKLRTLPQWRYEQTAAYTDGVIVRRS
jgi:hypothetical protein